VERKTLMIVVDCTVLADFWVGEPFARQAAQRLLARDDSWISVGLWCFELGNVLLKYVRAGRLTEPEMRLALIESRQLVSETIDDIDIEGVWSVAMEKNLSYYDASYVWLAKSRGLALYSRDSGILRTCPEVAVAMPEEI
jgi:predicted nucleic acid-binding protein